MWCIQNSKEKVEDSIGLVLVGMHKEGYEQELEFQSIPEYVATLPPEEVERMIKQIEIEVVKRSDYLYNVSQVTK